MAQVGPPCVVVMGVSGSGKSTVGALLAARLDVPYADGDAFHSRESIAKMASSTPLTDADRAPWLAAIGAFLHQHAERGAVVSCSALRRAYRAALDAEAPGLIYLHLHGDELLLRARVSARTRHFMPMSLLASQLATLEPLGEDEHGIAIDVAHAPSEIVELFLAYVRGPT